MRRFAFCLLVMAAAVPVQAAPMTAIKAAQLSAELYATGLALGDPVLMLGAARLRKPLNFIPTDRAPDGQQPVIGAMPGCQDMLAAAEPLAEGDDALLGLIDDLRAEASKGIASGPLYNIASLAAGASDSYPAAAFVGGITAEAYVEPQADADLNIRIYDAAGKLVCADADPSPIAYCSWRPAETGAYVMKVENLGPDSATYALMTN